MINNRIVFTLMAVLVAVAGCASKPPARAVYSGQDGVGALSSNLFIGNWNVRVMNPIEGEQNGVTSASYSPDGKVIMISNPSTEGLDMTLKMTGRWEIQGDLIMQTLESIEETSGSKLGAFLKPFLAGMKDNATGTANVFEANADRIVLVSIEDGQALEYTRFPN